MTNIQRIRSKQYLAILLVAISAGSWAFAEFYMSSAARVVAAICCILAAIHLGWRIERDRTRDKRADATMVAFYGVGILKEGGADRLRRVFESILAKKESIDRFGCTDVLVSEEVSKELFSFLREKKSASNEQKPSA